MMNIPQRELHDHISEISERTDVRAGTPLPLGTQERDGGINLAVAAWLASPTICPDSSPGQIVQQIITLRTSAGAAGRSAETRSGAYQASGRRYPREYHPSLKGG